jgi:hypothetical protein
MIAPLRLDVSIRWFGTSLALLFLIVCHDGFSVDRPATQAKIVPGATLYLEGHDRPEVVRIETSESSTQHARVAAKAPTKTSAPVKASATSSSAIKRAGDKTTSELNKLKGQMNRLEDQLARAKQRPPETKVAKSPTTVKQSATVKSPTIVAKAKSRLPAKSDSRIPDPRPTNDNAAVDVQEAADDEPVKPLLGPTGTPRAVAVSAAFPAAPVAKKSNLPGFVISPFPPYKLIDATELSARTVVKDPDSGAVFRLPKDLVEVTVLDISH